MLGGRSMGRVSWYEQETARNSENLRSLDSEISWQQSENRAFLKGGDLNPREQHSRDTQDDSTVTLCSLRAAAVLSRNCCADFARPLAKKVMSHSRDGPGVTAPSQTNIIPLTAVWNPPPSVTPPLKSSREKFNQQSAN